MAEGRGGGPHVLWVVGMRGLFMGFRRPTALSDIYRRQSLRDNLAGTRRLPPWFSEAPAMNANQDIEFRGPWV